MLRIQKVNECGNDCLLAVVFSVQVPFREQADDSFGIAYDRISVKPISFAASLML
jgi:hypothetical protein